jgi:hypothetical protein
MSKQSDTVHTIISSSFQDLYNIANGFRRQKDAKIQRKTWIVPSLAIIITTGYHSHNLIPYQDRATTATAFKRDIG